MMKMLYSLLAIFFGISIVVLSCAVIKRVHTGEEKKMVATLSLKSSLFEEGGKLPKQVTCDGANVSPQLSWGNVPEGTQTFAIICDDPDAPGKTWVHWVLFNLPPSVTNLNEGVPKSPLLVNGGKQGKTDFGDIGYGGACPPRGHSIHRYFFKIISS